MKSRKGIGFQSALLVSTPVIAGFFVLSLISWWLGASAIAVLFLTFSVIGGISHIWGMSALKNVGARVRYGSTGLSAGESTAFSYEISNDKLLALTWLEICQDVPENGCLMPDGTMTLRVFSEAESEYSGKKNAYMRRFAFLLGHRTLSFSCVWTGKRRGVYRPGNLYIRTGDGFGLTQSVSEIPGLSGRTFAVWPGIIPVNSSLLMRNVWTGTAGRMGWTEDITLLRDEKEYKEGDSWKRIDWRTAARTGELYTKYFEKIRPQSVILAVDTAAFSDKEQALSVAASLLYDLYAKGVPAGLALPATKRKEAVLIRPDAALSELETLLFELADHDAENASPDDFNVRGILSASEEAGHIWIMGENEGSVRAGRLYRALSGVSPGILCADEGSGALSFSRIRI